MLSTAMLTEIKCDSLHYFKQYLAFTEFLSVIKISYLCLSVEMAGSNTKGTRKRKAKTLTIQAVPRNKDV